MKIGLNGLIMTASARKPLYHRLGGYNAIASVVKELYGRMVNDSHVWYHWKGLSTESIATESRRFTELVCAAAGKHGASPRQDATKGQTSLGISNVEWEYFVNLAADTLDKSGLAEKEREELFSMMARSKAAITVDRQARPSTGVFAAFPHQLTQREQEVLRLVALGMNNPEIAGELFISINTVTRHISNIFAKTSTSNRVQAAVYASRRHLV